MFFSKYQTTIFSLILSLAIVFFVWAFNNPTAGPPGGSGAISVDGSGNVGIGTATPTAKLDVNGGVIVRGILDIASNRITNVGAPVVGTDVVNKEYVDSKGSTGGSPARLWGEGRTGLVINNSAGECTRSGAGQFGENIKVSRGRRSTHWDGSAAGCPAGWWVCTAAERGTIACGSSSVGFDAENCTLGSSDEYSSETDSNKAWVADVGASTSYKTGRIVDTAGVVYSTGANGAFICSIRPVWCCAVQ
jgi:hypothetical protein